MVSSVKVFTYLTVLFGLLVLGIKVNKANECPTTSGGMKRIGTTRYFIYQIPRGKKNKYVTWEEAKKRCSSMQNFKMATIEKLTTFAEVGRALEKLVTDKFLQDTWYWLDARYNSKLQQYVWGDDQSRPLKFTNYFYRYPRPTGVGAFVDQYDAYKINATIEQCLTLALPYPATNNMKMTSIEGIIFGYSASFDEKPCVGKTKRHAICESTLAECNSPITDAFTLSENKDAYFEEGNWIIGNRRYIINWKQATKKESEEYCKKLGLELVNPIVNSVSIIPHLKLWARGITLSQFWINWSYQVAAPGDMSSGVFYDADGKKVARLRAFANFSSTGRSDKFDTTFCVAMQHSYEFKHSQFPCPKKYEKVCNWNFIQYVPANCENLQGTVCQHQNYFNRSSQWANRWMNNTVEFLNNASEATVEFGFVGNTNTFRSKYKQTFGSLICPPGYRMPRQNDTKWYMKPMKTDYIYDYLETYWIVDDEGFMKTNTSQCAVSAPSDEGYNRTIKMVPCTDWYFYICDMVYLPMKTRDYKLQYEIPKLIPFADDKRFERHYPIIT